MNDNETAEYRRYYGALPASDPRALLNQLHGEALAEDTDRQVVAALVANGDCDSEAEAWAWIRKSWAASGLEELNLTELTELVAPGGRVQRTLNREVLAELRRRNRTQTESGHSATCDAFARGESVDLGELNKCPACETEAAHEPTTPPAPAGADPSDWDALYKITTDGCGTVRAETGGGKVLQSYLTNDEDDLAGAIRNLLVWIGRDADEHP